MNMARHVNPNVPTVLLVEDSPDERQMYAEYLRIQQFRAVQINNTEDALALARTADIIVTGILVPGPFDGVELVRRLRADNRTKHKPIIVVTACAFEPHRQHAYAAGCDGFLPKPCLPGTLLAEIQRALSIRSIRRPQPVPRGTRNGRRVV